MNDSYLKISQGIALYLASLLGAGLLVMPALAYREAGPSSLIAWGALLLTSCPISFTFARLGSLYPDSSGVAGFAKRALGDNWGHIVGFWFVFALPFGAPGTALVGATYVAESFGLTQQSVFWISCVLMFFSGLASIAGAKLSSTIQLLLLAIFTLVIVVAALGSVRHFESSNASPFAPGGMVGIIKACGVLFFTFAGWEAVAPLVRDFKNPLRDVGIVTRSTLLIVSAIYLTLAVSSIFSLGSGMTKSNTPIRDMLLFTWPKEAGYITGVLAAILTYGAMMAYFTGAARMASALARDGWLPAGLTWESKVGKTPRVAGLCIIFCSFIVLFFVNIFGVDLSVVMTLASAMFIAVTLAGLVSGVVLIESFAMKFCAAAACLIMVVVLFGCGLEALYPVLVATIVFVLSKIRRFS